MVLSCVTVIRRQQYRGQQIEYPGRVQFKHSNISIDSLNIIGGLQSGHSRRPK